MSRLVIVSNRVAVPGENRAGGLAVALRAALEEQGGLWFGWSGKTVREASGALHEQVEGGIRYVTIISTSATTTPTTTVSPIARCGRFCTSGWIWWITPAKRGKATGA